MAERGRETLRHGPMKPVGLTNAHAPTVKPYAVVQLRQDNALGTLFNMVGFQTKLKYGEQARIFRMIPGLERAEFARLGGIHRNTYLNSPKLLDGRLRLKAAPRLRFAGQITGCEGYVESAAVGLIAGRLAAAERLGRDARRRRRRPRRSARSSTTSPAATSKSIDAGPRSFQPMNVNFGLFPPIAEPRIDEAGKRLRGPERGLARKRALSARAEKDLAGWMRSACRSPRAHRQLWPRVRRARPSLVGTSLRERKRAMLIGRHERHSLRVHSERCAQEQENRTVREDRRRDEFREPPCSLRGKFEDLTALPIRSARSPSSAQVGLKRGRNGPALLAISAVNPDSILRRLFGPRRIAAREPAGRGP